MVLDHPAELAKITHVLGTPPDLTLVVRLAVDNTAAACPLAGKFGADASMVVELLQAIHALGLPAGLSFHVGSQCLAPAAYTGAIAYANQLAEHAGVRPAVLDVGGGFPTALTADIPPLTEFFQAIEAAHIAAPWLCEAALWAEPGRALVAAAGSLLARIELRKDHVLYLNDGTYGGLFEAGPAVGLVYPVQARRNGQCYPTGPMQNFSLFGPTCDSADHMPGPFSLPAEIQAGDWLEFQHIGAYCQPTRSNFNGFGGGRLYLVENTYEPVKL
jgi:ornithine decarboxylase